MPDDVVNSNAPTVVPPEQFDAMVDDSEKHDTPFGYIASAALGALNTAAPVIGSKIVGDPELQKELKESNPISYNAGQVAGMFIGPVGKLIGVAGKGVATLAGEGITGAAANMATQAALLQTTDEVAKYVLNDPNQSVQTAMSDIALSAIIGGALGGVGGLASKGIQKVADTKAGEFLNDFKNRISEHVAPDIAPAPEAFNPDYLKVGSPKDTPMFTEGAPVPKPELSNASSLGAKAADAFMKSKLAGSGLGFEAGQMVGHMTGIPGMGYMAGIAGAKTLGPTLDAIIKPLIRGAVGVSGEGLNAAQNFIKGVVKGDELMGKAAKAVFSVGASDISNLNLKADKSKVSQLDSHIQELQDHPEALMNVGGSLGHYLPDQHTALASTTQNAVNYLSAQKPRPIQPMPLDKPVEPSSSQLANYNRTLQIAEQPMVILQHIKDGTLKPKDVQDLNTLYPAIAPKLIQKLNNHMIDHMSSGKSVPFKVKRGLSMLMGQPLDSNMTQPSRMAIQATFMPTAQPTMPQASKPSKGSPSKVGKTAEMAMTPEQSRIKALSKA